MKKPFEIRIESILGGHSQTSNFAGSGQFRSSYAIDPAQPIDDLDTIYSTVASGFIRPVGSTKISGSVIQSSPLFIQTNPKNAYVYVYDARGSIYTIDSTITTVTAISDAGEMTNSLGNGMAYCDNYMYFAKNTTIARLGPLDGTTTLNGDYWVTTLSKTALSNTVYPTTFLNNLQIPNHPMCRHSDGNLYIGDVVGNQGYLHYIATKKTTVEGDTNNGSTYLKLGFGYGLWPTCIESYGEELAIALYEGSNTGLRQKQAKIAFWDTTSTNMNKIVWVEFPDSMITAMKNVNGVLYVVSGNYKTTGFRVSRFLGGYSFEEVFYSETGEPCLQGAIDSVLNRVVFGTWDKTSFIDEGSNSVSKGCVYGIGLQKASLGNGIFNIMGATGVESSTCVTSVAFSDSPSLNFYTPIIGWTEAGDGSTGADYGIDQQTTDYSSGQVFQSPVYRIGQPFKITEIHIPLCQRLASGMQIHVKILTDDGLNLFITKDINPTYLDELGKNHIIRRSASSGEVITGNNNFWLRLDFYGSTLCTVGLPIIIKGEIYDE